MVKDTECDKYDQGKVMHGLLLHPEGFNFSAMFVVRTDPLENLFVLHYEAKLCKKVQYRQFLLRLLPNCV